MEENYVYSAVVLHSTKIDKKPSERLVRIKDAKLFLFKGTDSRGKSEDFALLVTPEYDTRLASNSLSSRLESLGPPPPKLIKFGEPPQIPCCVAAGEAVLTLTGVLLLNEKDPKTKTFKLRPRWFIIDPSTWQTRTGGYQHYVSISARGQTRTFIITKQDLPNYPQKVATSAPYGGLFRLLHQVRPMRLIDLDRFAWCGYFADVSSSTLRKICLEPGLVGVYFDHSAVCQSIADTESIGITEAGSDKLTFLSEMKTLEFVSLTACGLVGLPESLSTVRSLKHLVVENNRIHLFNFQSNTLETLTISTNPLTEMKLVCPNLRVLLANNCRLRAPPPLGLIQLVDRLELNDNQIGDDSAGMFGALPNLRVLRLAGNRFTAFPDCRLLYRLEKLSLESNNISLRNGFVTSIPSLNELHLGSNPLGILPDGFPALLPHLQHLSLPNCSLTKLPLRRGDWENLLDLDISHNALESLPGPLGGMGKLTRLVLRGNPLSTLPPELLSSCESSPRPLQAFLQDLGDDQQAAKWNSLKLVVVGEEAVGKTSLIRNLLEEKRAKKARRLKQGEGDADPVHTVSTDGITISPWVLPGTSITLNIWDFGGQEVFYPTHQFFLTSRSIYLVCLNLIQPGFKRVEYWLQQVKARTTKTQVILVATHYDKKRSDADIEYLTAPLSKLKARFPFIEFCVFVSSATGAGIVDLRTQLKDMAEAHPLLQTNVPKSWLDLEAAVLARKATDHYMLLGDFANLAHQCGVSETSLPTAMAFLHDVGTLTWFEDKRDGPKSIVIFDSQWLADVMSSLISFKNSWAKHGAVAMENLTHVWKGQYPESMYEPLKQLLYKFEIAFTSPDGKSLIIPSLLDEAPSDYSQIWQPEPLMIQMENVLQNTRIYQFRFMPLGFFSRLLVRLYALEDAEIRLSWRYGVILHSESQDVRLHYDPSLFQLEITSRSHLQSPVAGLFGGRSTAPLFSRSKGTSGPQELVPFSLCSSVIKALETLLDGYYPGYIQDLVRVVPCNHCLYTHPGVPAVRFKFTELIAALHAGSFVVCKSQHRKDTANVRIQLLAPDLEFTGVPLCENVKIERQLAEGAFGIVYKGIMNNATPVAIKQLKSKQDSEQDTFDAFSEFQREVSIMCSLSHPNIVCLFGIRLNPFQMVMEFVASGDLYHFLYPKNTPPPTLTPELRLKMAWDLAAGMKFLASCSPPIIHRDLRSPNVFISELTTALEMPCLKVADFGLSREVIGQTAGMLGAWQWLAPEVFDANSLEYDIMSDVYSFAMVVNEIFSMTIPYDEYHDHFKKGNALNERAVKTAILEQGLRPTWPASVPQTLLPSLILATDRDPSRRPTFSRLHHLIGRELGAPSSLDQEEEDRIAREELSKGQAAFTITQKDRMATSSAPRCALYVTVSNTMWIGSETGELSIWSAEHLSLVRKIAAHLDKIYCLAQIEGSVWSSSLDRVFKVWSGLSFDLLRTVDLSETHAAEVRSIIPVFSGDSLFVWTAGVKGTIAIWEPKQSYEPRQVLDIEDNIRFLMPRGRYIFALLSKSLVQIAVDDLEITPIFDSTNQRMSNDFALLGDNVWLGVGSDIYPFSISSGKTVCRLTGHTAQVQTLTQAGWLVFSGSFDTTINVWDSRTFELLQTISSVHTDTVNVLTTVPLSVQGDTETVGLISCSALENKQTGERTGVVVNWMTTQQTNHNPDWVAQGILPNNFKDTLQQTPVYPLKSSTQGLTILSRRHLDRPGSRDSSGASILRAASVASLNASQRGSSGVSLSPASTLPPPGLRMNSFVSVTGQPQAQGSAPRPIGASFIGLPLSHDSPPGGAPPRVASPAKQPPGRSVSVGPQLNTVLGSPGQPQGLAQPQQQQYLQRPQLPQQLQRSNPPPGHPVQPGYPGQGQPVGLGAPPGQSLHPTGQPVGRPAGLPRQPVQQPYPGQPHPNQPHPNQPHPYTHPNQGQPYPGQPRPDYPPQLNQAHPATNQPPHQPPRQPMPKQSFVQYQPPSQDF